MTYKKFIINYFIITLVIILVPSIIVFIVDPLQLYHRQVTLKEIKYYKEQRHQNIGLINNYLVRGSGIYTIIMGTSMSENFIPSIVKKELNDGTKVLKLTMSGGRPFEQYILIKKALDTKKVKRVIWDIHWYYLLNKLSKKDKNHDFPYKLYSNNFFQKSYYYLFNQDYFKNSILIFLGIENKKYWTKNLDKLNYTMDDWLKSKKFIKHRSKKNINKMNEEIKKVKSNIPNLHIIEKRYAKKLNYPNIDRFLIPIFKKYKNVEFDIFFPPYSTYFYAKNNINKSIRFIYGRKYLINKTKNLHNVKIFGFDNNYNIVNNICNYKDYGHYSADINNIILNNIVNKENIINKKNIDSYLEKMINNINNYQKVNCKN